MECCSQEIGDAKLRHDRAWSDHFWKTQRLIRTVVLGGSCKIADQVSLYENQSDLAESFGILAGSSIAYQKLKKELYEHIRIAIEIVGASIEKSPTDNLIDEWKKNARKIGSIYHHFNNDIHLITIQDMMLTHLKLLLSEASSIIEKDCVNAISSGDEGLNHIHKMSEYIISKFKCGCNCNI